MGVGNEISNMLIIAFKAFYNWHFRKTDHLRMFVDLFVRVYENSHRGLNDIEYRVFKGLREAMVRAMYATNSELSELSKFVKEYREFYDGAYVIDDLGVPELYALWCRAQELRLNVDLYMFVNVKANTRAFKEVFGEETMAAVARVLGAHVFRRFDESVHRDLSTSMQRDELISKIMGRMYDIQEIIRNMSERVVIVSDHGYDVEIVNGMYRAEHVRLKNPAFAKLSTVLLVKPYFR